jgi:hypothetical protein
MTSAEASPNPVRQQDVAVLLGIVAIVEGGLLGGAVDPATVSKIATKFVTTGLLSRQPNGDLPSAGRVAIAMDNLIGRLEFALGEYESEPEPRKGMASAHVLRFPTEEAASSCRAELLGQQADRVLMERDGTHGWTLYAVYPELPPDPEFLERERMLQQIALRFGGTYLGSQAPPQ